MSDPTGQKFSWTGGLCGGSCSDFFKLLVNPSQWRQDFDVAPGPFKWIGLGIAVGAGAFLLCADALPACAAAGARCVVACGGGDQATESLQASLDVAAAHLSDIDAMVPENEMMLTRISDALEDGRALTEGEQNFLLHETTEARLMADGMEIDEAHAQALATHPTFGNYDPEVIKALPESFNPNWLDYWNNR
jgi:hypothetical protein